MRIESASVAMNASRKYESSSVTMRRFMITEVTAGSLQGGNLTATGGDTKASGEEGQEQTTGTKENTGMSLRDWQSRFQTKISSVSLRSSASQTYEEIRNQTIRYIYELFFGNRQSRGNWLDTALGRNSGTESSQGSTQADSTQTDNTRTENQTGTTGTLNKSQGEGNLIWLVNSPTARYKRLEDVQESYYQEKESTSFSTVGTVRTGDGREINFNINVGMSRSFEERYREQLDLASFTFCDPLVINLDTDAAELTDQTMFFDIDADGTPDEVAGLGSGSGYLALDKNGDGILQYVMLEGEPGHQDALLRTEYSVKTLMTAGVTTEKLDNYNADWQRGLATVRMQQWLETFGDEIEVVFANNDDMALGAIDACLEAGMTQEEMPFIVGVDATPPALEALAEGTLQGTVRNDAAGQAQGILDLT